MNTKILSLALSLMPAALVAQGRAQSSATGSASANASSQSSVDIPANFTAEGRARLEAIFQRARTDSVPTTPLSQRIAEGQAKGAAEASIIASVAKLETNLDITHDLFVKAGRNPSYSEVAQGANAMDRGVTSVQLSALISHATPDRPLTVALDVLGSLAASGTPVTQALTQIQAKLDAGLPDASISGLVSVKRE
jgi:hypothetical protein